MFITKLDIVNACLRSMGENQINTLEDDHPYRDTALTIIEEQRMRVLGRKLWFNTEWLRLVPQSDTKYILIPNDVLTIAIARECGAFDVDQRGGRLYDAQRNTYEFTASVNAWVSRNLDYEVMPYLVQQYIKDHTVLEFQDAFDGDNTKYQKIELRARDSAIELSKEHIRQLKINVLAVQANPVILQARYGTRGIGVWHWQRTWPG